MKVLTTLTVSGGLNMASTAKDVFTIGTPLEHNDGNVDDLYVYANADFKNNVILGSSSLDMVTVNGNLVINPVATPPTPQEGQIYYDSDKHELVYNSEVSTALNSIGRSLLIRAKNTDTVTLTKGMAVRVSTPQGANKTFVRALSVNIPLTGAAGNQIIGVISSDIAVNDFGYATTFGEITGLNTNTFIEGDQVYVSSTTSGSLTGSRPTAPFEIIPVGICLSQHPTQGKIFVKTRDPTHFGDITGFNPDTTNLLNGQVIRYRSSDGTWGNSNSGVVLTGSFSGSLQSDQITSSGGILLQDSSLYLTGANASIFVNGQDLLGGGGGGEGSPSITDVQSTGSGTSIVSTNIDNIIYLKSISGDTDRITVQNDENNETVLINLQPQNYDYSIVVPATASIGNNSNNQSEVFYCNNQGNISQSYLLVDAQSFIKRVITIKNISTQYNILVEASGSDTIDGSSTLTISPNHAYTLHSVDNSGYKWYIIGKYS